ncbi:tetratricopeptide repeat protein [Nocardia sp. NPDC050630]|uniref:tetratricopeptide repeat protein n=1 Tax=Nocardia sp. NPDC050630 TaxID=3364321 RepID=UPI0037A1FCC4
MTGPRGHETPQQITPRSSIWEGVLGTAEVVAWALVLELGRNIVVNSLGDNDVVKVIGGLLRGLAIIAVVGAGAYVAYRRIDSFRERVRTERELALIAELVEPGEPVRFVDARSRPDPPRQLSELDHNPILAALRDLPVQEFETAALLAVLSAVLEAPSRLPSDSAPDGRTAILVLADLEMRGIIGYLGADRYCLREAPRLPPTAEVIRGPHWQAALPALLHHYADRASRWSIALETVRFAKGARRWFEAEEEYLRTLFPTPATRLPTAAVNELARIADALDVWYARKGLPEHAHGVAQALCDLTDPDDFPLRGELARLRAGRLRRRPPKYRPRALSSSLSARWSHYTALHRLHNEQPSPMVLTQSAEQLEAAWWLLPRTDLAGVVCALINLAVVHLHEGRLDAAQDRLELAESLTRDGRDPAGGAQTRETLGALWWTRGEPRRALRHWQRALTAYRELDDDLGTGRCLQHLGSAVVLAPEHGGLLLGNDPALTRAEVLRQAGGWLAAARRLHPQALHVEHYARRAGSTLHTVDRWPLAAPDPQ